MTFAASAADATILKYAATLRGAYEVPKTPSRGEGQVTAVLDTDTATLKYSVTYSGLSGPGTGAHFHGPAKVGAEAPVVVPVSSVSSPITGTAQLTAAQITDLNSGKWYFNVHTNAYPNGEIRGQLRRDGP